MLLHNYALNQLYDRVGLGGFVDEAHPVEVDEDWSHRSGESHEDQGVEGTGSVGGQK